MNVQNAITLFDYAWYLKNGYSIKGIEKNNLKVFSTFACGGGSTMGYKLAGYDVIAANDIDPQMQAVYLKNHDPKHFYLCPINELLDKELPKELHDLDILDGSPLCSVFSVAGQRDKNWGKAKKFREGQSKQVLDDLFFDFINLVCKLRPKVVVAENVKGMIIGKAIGYCKMIQEKMYNLGYDMQLFLLNSASMGVPQARERVFFIFSRFDLGLPKLKLQFNFEQIPFKEISDDQDQTKSMTVLTEKYWERAKEGTEVGKFKSIKKVFAHKPISTILATNRHFHHKYKRPLNNRELTLAGSFPLDYNFMKIDPGYLIGMSVPPVMMAQVAHQIYLQWFLSLKK
jgi:DNA (cytosine-5)-methyltransferase 1